LRVASHATHPEITIALSTITQASSSFCVISALVSFDGYDVCDGGHDVN
jgi:hypothetical protein